jgi:protein O-GlcNAc transferase
MAPPAPEPRDLLSLAIGDHQAGRLVQAAAGYRQVLLTSPNHAEALRLLGLIALQSGDLTNGVALIGRSVAANPANPWAHNSLGEAYRMRNERGLAADCFRRAISLKPDFIEAYNNLGQVHVADHRYAEAAAVYQKLLEHRPDDAGAHFELGTIHLHRLQANEARAHFDEALRLKPAYAEARNNLGKALQLEGNLDRAFECYRTAAAEKPDFALPHFNIGMVLQEREQFAAAREAYRMALTIDPLLADAHSRMGAAFHAEARYADARACYERALALRPNEASLHLNIGNTWFVERRLAEAETSYRNALNADPKLAQTYVNLGYLYRQQGDMPAASRNFSEALVRNPDLAEARWAFTMSKLPLVYGLGESPEAARIEFAKALDELDSWFTGDRVAGGHQAVGSQQPFYLAYQEKNNVALLRQYGDLCARLMRHWWGRQGLTVPSATAVDGRKIRVGVVSAQIGDHSVWNAIGKGWVRHMDRDRFSLHLFHLGQTRDAETAFVRAHAAHFEQSAHGLRGWVDAILGQAPDVLLYPEIGMDPMTSKLASLRLATVQAATWGHPETSGLPTIDYYLSAEGMEPAGAHANYREKLVLLPHLGCCYKPLELPDVDVDFAAMGVAPDIPLMLCPGTPYKYAPQHDTVLVAIARAMHRCQFVFCNDPVAGVSARLRERLAAEFTAAGLDPGAHLVFIPWQPRPAFRRLLARADVYLDTIGFSGFNTVMQALECALPVVTMEGHFLRGRFGSGILRRIGLDECVAGSIDNYIAKAVELGRNAGARQATREKITASRALLFDDLAPVRALESFLLEVTGPR